MTSMSSSGYGYSRIWFTHVETGEEFLLSFEYRSSIDVCLKKGALYRLRKLLFFNEDTHIVIRTADGVKGELFFGNYGEGWFHTAEGTIEPPADYHGFYRVEDASQLSSIPLDVEFLVIAPPRAGDYITAALNFSQFSKLELLFVHNVNHNSSVEVKNLPSLRMLRMYGGGFMQNASDSVVIQGCPSLSALTIQQYGASSIIIKSIVAVVYYP